MSQGPERGQSGIRSSRSRATKGGYRVRGLTNLGTSGPQSGRRAGREGVQCRGGGGHQGLCEIKEEELKHGSPDPSTSDPAPESR